MKKNTAKQLKKAQKVTRNEALTSYLNFLLSGQVESEEQVKNINYLAKKTATFAEAAAIARILTAQVDHKLSQVMETVRVQEIILEQLGVSDEMFQAAQNQYEQELAEVEKQLSGATDVTEDTNEAEEPTEEEISEGELEELKEALEANDADPREEE